MKYEEQKATHPGWRQMTANDLAGWGLQDVAFIKRVIENGDAAWAIYSADGTHMGTAPSRDLAFAAVRQHDLDPYSVH